MSISGYISIYNDWDILERALGAVAPYIDELVLVDGGYRWMATYLSASGRNPARSVDRVYDIIDSSGISTRVLHGPWDNELQKRATGYSACTGDYVLRFDADEVFYFDDEAMARFVDSKLPVAQVEIPMYFAPGRIQGPSPNSPHLPRLGCLFDRRLVHADEHLRYLWLISKDDWSVETAEIRDFPLFHDPIAFAAHLSGWRTPETAVQRAAFYILDYARNNGLPWHPALWGRSLRDSAEVLEHVEAAVVGDLLAGSGVVAGFGHRHSCPLAAPPLSVEQERSLLPMFVRFLESHTRMHESLRCVPRHFAQGVPFFFEITAPASLAALASANGPSFHVESATVLNASATVSYLLTEPPWETDVAATVEVNRDRVQIGMPPQELAPASYVRRVLGVTIGTDAVDQIGRLRCA